jgi:hypothetical protein
VIVGDDYLELRLTDVCAIWDDTRVLVSAYYEYTYSIPEYGVTVIALAQGGQPITRCCTRN